MLTYEQLPFQNELGRGERLLWNGQPKQGLLLRPSDTIQIPFSLMWGGFAIFWETLAIRGGAPVFFRLWGIPFVLIGLYMIVGRFFVEAAQRSRTYYAVTDQRVLIVSGVFVRNVRSLSLKTLSDINLSVKRDGKGTIGFGSPHPMSFLYSNFSWPGQSRTTAPAFEMIVDARRVYDLIRQAQHENIP